MAAAEGVGGLLLTGGRSRRMGTDKARMRLAGDDRPLAAVLADRLSSAAFPLYEVGPARSGLPVVEGDPGEGPLTAVAAGWEWLKRHGHGGSVLVLATDMPFVSEALLAWLARHPLPGSVVPVSAGRAQPLCARWCPEDLDRTVELAAAGERALRLALGAGAAYLDEASWGDFVGHEAFADADTPDEARRVGLRPPGTPPGRRHRSPPGAGR